MERHETDCTCPSCLNRVVKNVYYGKTTKFGTGQADAYVVAVSTHNTEGYQWAYAISQNVPVDHIKELIDDLQKLVASQAN